MQVAQPTPVPAKAPADAPSDPTDLTDADWIVKAGSNKTFSFTLPKAAPVHISVAGVKNADKGFTILVASQDDVNACVVTPSGCKGIPGFGGMGVKSLDHTDTIPAGSWAFILINSENMMNALTAHVHIVVNPKS